MERKVRIYVARAMSGRPKDVLVAEAELDKSFFEAAGFEVLDPVAEEGVKAENKVLLSTKKEMDSYWFRDKELIRRADVVVDATPHLLSQGVMHEIGLARYCYWKPVVRMFPYGRLPADGNVAYYEDDVVTDDPFLVVESIYRLFETRRKRLLWRLRLLNRCLPKWVGQQIRFLLEA
jgi:hypothetical protein